MIDLTFRALLARSHTDPGLLTILGLGDSDREVGVLDRAWDMAAEDAAAQADVGNRVVRPVPSSSSDEVALEQMFDATRRWSAAGVEVAADLHIVASSVPAVVTASMVAGARILVLPRGAGADMERDARRAADVTEALLVERAGAMRDRRRAESVT